MTPRIDGREHDQIRQMEFLPGFIEYPEGSVLITAGKTKILCNATINEDLPRWMKETGNGGGWVTAEYALLPRSTHSRTRRETSGFGGRTQEIRRLIGRSLRAALNLDQLGERMVIVDCDVLQADGGTRTASITGGYLAMALALQPLVAENTIPAEVFRAPIAAISVGIVDGKFLVDLSYDEDSRASLDLNIVMNTNGNLIEIQGNAERNPFTIEQLNRLIELAQRGLEQIFDLQSKVLDR